MTDEPEMNDIMTEMPTDSMLFDDDTPLSDIPDPWQGLEIRPRSDKSTDQGPSNVSLSADDANAEADLPRPSRAEKHRARRRTQLSTVIPALLLIAGGVLALVRPGLITPPLALGITISAVTVTLILRFLIHSRKERGLFFIAAVLLLAMGFVALLISGTLDMSQNWPLLITLPGFAMLITFVFERTHDRGLLLPGFMLIAAGGAISLFTAGYFDSSVLPSVALYWPLLFLIVALAVLPHAIRDRAE